MCHMRPSEDIEQLREAVRREHRRRGHGGRSPAVVRTDQQLEDVLDWASQVILLSREIRAYHRRHRYPERQRQLEQALTFIARSANEVGRERRRLAQMHRWGRSPERREMRERLAKAGALLDYERRGLRKMMARTFS